jgi:hypothetical protein
LTESKFAAFFHLGIVAAVSKIQITGQMLIEMPLFASLFQNDPTIGGLWFFGKVVISIAISSHLGSSCFHAKPSLAHR